MPGTWGLAQECTAGTLGLASGHLHGTQIPAASPSLIIRAVLIILCKCGEMDFTFPPARLCTALHLLSPFKNTESSEKGNGSFYLFASRVGTGLSSNHPGLWSAKLPFVVRFTYPPDCLQDTHRQLHASKQVISWFSKTYHPEWWKCYSICWQAIR